MMPKFSICIPNYNYEKYLGETIESVLNQTFDNFEIVVADNASTDNSLKVISDYNEKDARLSYQVNASNVGFAGNLLKASEMAKGEWMTMLSSDDLLHSKFLSNCDEIVKHFSSEKLIISSSQQVIDGESKPLYKINIDWKLWNGADKNIFLTNKLGVDVYEMDAAKLMHNSLLLMRTPFAFASTTYSKKLFNAVGGYIQGGIINPDKKFAWAILGKAEKAIFIDYPLVFYRVHSNNQASQQLQSGALKHLVDEYVSTFQLSDEQLKFANIDRSQLQKAFIENDVILRGLLELANGNRKLAKRMLDFGKAAYPEYTIKNSKYWPFKLLLILGGLGSIIARKFKDQQIAKWEKQKSL